MRQKDKSLYKKAKSNDFNTQKLLFHNTKWLNYKKLPKSKNIPNP